MSWTSFSAVGILVESIFQKGRWSPLTHLLGSPLPMSNDIVKVLTVITILRQIAIEIMLYIIFILYIFIIYIFILYFFKLITKM